VPVPASHPYLSTAHTAHGCALCVVPLTSRVCKLRVHAHTASHAAPRSRAKWACGRQRAASASGACTEPLFSTLPSCSCTNEPPEDRPCAIGARCEPRIWTSARHWPRSNASVALSHRAAAAANSAWLIRTARHARVLSNQAPSVARRSLLCFRTAARGAWLLTRVKPRISGIILPEITRDYPRSPEITRDYPRLPEING